VGILEVMNCSTIKVIAISGLLAVLASCTSQPAQNQAEVEKDGTPSSKSVAALFPYGAEYTGWKVIEKQVAPDERKRFMDTVPWYNTMYGDSGNPDHTHVLDLDGDKTDDYIYAGPGPGDDDAFIIKINDEVYYLYGKPNDLRFRNGRLEELFLTTVEATAAPAIDGQNSYRIVYGNPTKIEKYFHSATIGGLRFPDKLLPEWSIETFLGDSILIRDSPVIDNDEENPFVPSLRGNQLGRLRDDASALVLAETLDAHSRRWLFVALVPGSEIDDFMLYPEASDVRPDNVYYPVWILAPKH
jgi:hypothetical protein